MNLNPQKFEEEAVGERRKLARTTLRWGRLTTRARTAAGRTNEADAAENPYLVAIQYRVPGSGSAIPFLPMWDVSEVDKGDGGLNHDTSPVVFCI